MAIILHENSHGIKIERTDFKRRSQVKVISYRDDGQHTHRTYRFNKTSNSFSSPFMSWENLDCCGGWAFDDKYLTHAVQDGKKLYAGIAIPLKGKYFHNAPTHERAASDLQQLQESLPPEICAGIDEHFPQDRWFRTYICRRGAIKDFFDLDAVFLFYENLGVPVSEHVKNTVYQYCNIEMSGFASLSAPYEYYGANSQAELITTGLLLGYPIESTVSLITGY